LWAIGVVALTVGQLNIMTQMMAVILLGLGIDFAIHIISGFTEYRAGGLSIQNALEETFLKVGRGVLTGGFTTACAFYAMIISQSRGMREMGLTTGSGLLAVLFATFLILPVFLVYRERRRDKKQNKSDSVVVQKDLSFKSLGNSGTWLAKNYRTTLLISLILTGLLIWSASTITFDSNYMNIEPEGITSVVLQDTILDKFDLSTDYAMILSDNPKESRELAKAYRDLGTVAMVEDISTYLPSQEERAERLPYLMRIQKVMESTSVRNRFNRSELPGLKWEIDRLRMNIIEMQDMAFLGGQDKVDNKCRDLVGNPEDENPRDKVQDLYERLDQSRTADLSHLQRTLAPYLKQTVLRMANTDPIELEDLPETVLDRYANTDRSQFLVTVYPAGSVWQDADFLRQFVADIESVSERATGMPPVFLALIEVIGKDGRLAMMLTLVVVFALLWIDFRNPKHALMAMVPLTMGLAWMIGLMKLTGQQFTAMNVMGLPMILGIGIDDGVHIVHRWVAEGKGKIHLVFASTGKAILLTTLTTMLGFGSLIFSIWRGFGHLGAALFVGVAACFLTTILFLSGIIGWIEHKQK
ncbi:MMPL family transporter, partial [candidate division KSB1 bacterium]|nr:MMPL family transporter [candidate division KSB1 bacterium]